jgi:hypothetical protein
MKVHELWFDDLCLWFWVQRKQTKMQWLQDPNHGNVDNLNNVRHEASHHFRNKKKEYLKDKIDEPENIGKIRNMRDLYRGKSDIKKCYQPRTNIVKDEKCSLVTDSHNILPMWRNNCSQLWNVHVVSEVRQTEIYTVEPLLPELVPLRLIWLLTS